MLSQAPGSYRFTLLEGNIGSDISFLQSCFFTQKCVRNPVFLQMLSIKSQGKLTALTKSLILRNYSVLYLNNK